MMTSKRTSFAGREGGFEERVFVVFAGRWVRDVEFREGFWLRDGAGKEACRCSANGNLAGFGLWSMLII